MISNLFQLLFVFNDWAVLLIRIVLGAILIIHGFPKIKNLKATIANFPQMGFKPGWLWGPLVAFLEFFGGIALVLGFYTQVVAILIAGQFTIIIIWKIIRKQKFVGGLEFDLLIWATALLLLTQGAGMFSLDRFFFFNY
ncbi:MAG: DoxX family protein [Patescibacteria group bacterium]|nr:DoxX family protein [Patescibacteria group bacterium]